jgi:cyclopropane fatty-acyl-phospholipid synthase-like methyltransferase/methyltransferase-like protein
MTADLKASYDELPYHSRPLRQTHPDHLATIASLFGFAATSVERCRVLEIGCAAGGNLIPMAACYPDAEFVGIDFSSVGIEEGSADVRAAGLANIRLLAMDVLDFDESHGTFDYIIAHGIYTWVPANVQDRILALCARQLTANGVALISYNTLPGWNMLAVVRDAMLYETRDIADAAERVAEARATLEFLSEAVASDGSAYGRLLRLAAENLRGKPDYYVLHEYLEEVNEPLYFHQFMARATPHGLRYLGEVDLKTMLSTGLAPTTAQTLQEIAPDLMRREQFLDLLRNRTFRQTLLIRDGPLLDRKVSPARITALRIAAPVQQRSVPADIGTGDAAVFLLSDGRTLTTRHPICKSALATLAGRWPVATTFDELFESACSRLDRRAHDPARLRDPLASEIIRWFVADAVELHSAPSPFCREPGPQPEASAFARLQASRDARATNLRHELVTLDDAMRSLMPLLDGTRTHERLAVTRWPALPPGVGLARLRGELDCVAQQAFLRR